MNRPSPTAERTCAAFTLVELLATLAIFSLIVVALVGAVSNISNSWTRSRQRMDNFSKARALLSTLDHDLGNAVVRPELTAFSDSLQKNPASADDLNKPISFFTREFGQTAYDANGRALTYVSYARVRDGTQRLFVRRSRSYGFNDSPDWQDAFQYKNTAPTVTFDPAQTGQLCGGVYGVVVRFVNTDATFSYKFNLPTVLSPVSPATPPPSSRALQISLLILGEQADQLATNSGLSDALEKQFADAVVASPDATVKTTWDRLLAGTGSTKLSYPSVILAGIITYERTIPLNPSAASLAHLPLGTNASY